MDTDAGTVQTLEPEKLVAGGAALAREPGGRVVMVAGAVPGDRVRVRYLSSKRDLATADVVEVLEPSIDRVVAPCPQVAAGCGGCGWQHIAVDAQRRHKVAIVAEALRRTGRIADPPVVAGRALSSEAVRTTVRLAVDDAGRVGFRAARSHRVVPTERCMVTHPLVDEVIASLHLPGASEVTVRAGVATGQRLAWWTPPTVARPADLPGDVRVGPRSMIHEVVSGHTFQVSARSFFQASLEGAEALVDAVRRAAGELAVDAARAVDAYSGVGLFAATVFAPDVEVLAVETAPSSCADARVNLSGRRATVVESAVERWRATPADLVVADPARQGLGRPGVEALVAATPQRIVLVSCDPVSLARDAQLLGAHGFHLVQSEVLDLFPHTPHVEVVSRFDR